MFDIGFLELLVCAIIALLVLGPERLPVAARAAGRWIGKARRLTRNFTAEMDRQLKAEELREKIRKEGSQMGADAIQRNFQEGLSEARKYKEYLVSDAPVAPPSGPAAPANATPATETSAEVPSRVATATDRGERDVEPRSEASDAAAAPDLKTQESPPR